MSIDNTKNTKNLVICEEVFDDGYPPSSAEINEYAIKIGIDPEKETHLLHLAKKGLLQPLPPNWKICYNDDLHAHYYFNNATNSSQWDHPLDAIYRDLVNKERKRYQSINNSYLTTDASEENSQLDSGIRSLQGNEDSELNTNEVSSNLTANSKMNYSNSRFIDTIGKRYSKLEPIRTSRFEVVKTNPQIDLDMRFNNDKIEKSIEDIQSEKKGFTITGKGAMFLKSNTRKSLSTLDDITTKPIDVNRPKIHNNDNLSPSVKGILRDSSLTDVRRRFDEDAEDKKSVRFNFEATKIKNKYSFENDANTLNKLLHSPDISYNSEENDYDDDPWDFMEDEHDEKKYVRDIKVVLGNKQQSILMPSKPLSNPQIGCDDISNESQMKILSESDETVNIDNSKEKSNVSILDKIKEINIVKPLYEDTDSDSHGSSVRSFIQKQDNENKLTIINDKKILEPIQYNSDKFNKLEDERIKEQNECKTETKKMINDKEIQKSIEKAIEIEQQKFDEILKKIKIDIEYQHKQQIKAIQTEYENEIKSLKESLELEQTKNLEKFRETLQEEYITKTKTIIEEHKTKMNLLQQNHIEIQQDLERDLKSEEEILKKEHTNKLSQMRDKLLHELDIERQRMRETGEDRLYEKTRCEKRLLEDKYRCLKEKYIRLKTDVKLSLERRNKRKEQAIQQNITTNTTGSETERSISNKPSMSNSENRSCSLSIANNDHDRQKNSINLKDSKYLCDEKLNDRQQSKDRKLGITSKYIKQLQTNYQDDTTTISHSDTTISNNYPNGRYIPIPSDNGNSDSEAFNRNIENNNNLRDRQRKKIFSRMKSASTSRLNSENYKIDRPCTPVENLRRQLQKLEDLEDQFPDNTLDTTYHLRYPFSDILNDHEGTSSELEFFKHRIHLERDSVRRAKESLRTQRTNFRTRQREIKQRHKISNNRHTLDQLINEEKELSEMEVNLHRTRALLGEKVIRLRHLEQSLRQIYQKQKPIEFLQTEQKDDGTTLSDLSSHSSSGFSSTDYASETNQANINRRKEVFQGSSECIQNLEILNIEIREILDILSKQQSQGLPIPIQIVNPDMNWSFLPSNSQGSSNISNTFLHTPQSIPTLADRLETYRQLATGRIQTTVSGATIAANTIVSQNPRALNYTTSLVERTRDLRNWLKQAKCENDIFFNRAINQNQMDTPSHEANL